MTSLNLTRRLPPNDAHDDVQRIDALLQILARDETPSPALERVLTEARDLLVELAQRHRTLAHLVPSRDDPAVVVARTLIIARHRLVRSRGMPTATDPTQPTSTESRDPDGGA